MSNPANAEAEKPLAYRVSPFCQRLGISRATFYKYVGLGKIRVIKIGGSTLVPAPEADWGNFTPPAVPTIGRAFE